MHSRELVLESNVSYVWMRQEQGWANRGALHQARTEPALLGKHGDKTQALDDQQQLALLPERTPDKASSLSDCF
jgi:hypothetical protein